MLGILIHLLLSAVHAVLVVLDIALVLVATRLLYRRWDTLALFQVLNDTGRPLVDALFQTIDRVLGPRGVLRENVKAVLCLVVLSAARIFMISLVNGLVS